MAVVFNIGYHAKPVINRLNWFERIFEQPFYQAEMNRVELTRAEHPSKVNYGIINLLFAWAFSYLGVCANWFVKYVI